MPTRQVLAHQQAHHPQQQLLTSLPQLLSLLLLSPLQHPRQLLLTRLLQLSLPQRQLLQRQNPRRLRLLQTRLEAAILSLPARPVLMLSMIVPSRVSSLLPSLRLAVPSLTTNANAARPMLSKVLLSTVS